MAHLLGAQRQYVRPANASTMPAESLVFAREIGPAGAGFATAEPDAKSLRCRIVKPAGNSTHNAPIAFTEMPAQATFAVGD
jgi:hypothetical protein